jgi:hypothetical protein
MRVVRCGIQREELPVEFESPIGVTGGTQFALRVQRHPTESVVTMNLSGIGGGVTAVWDASTGKLLWSPDQASDIGWTHDGRHAIVLASKFGRGPDGRGITHRLLRYAWPTRELLEELDFRVPSGGADSLVISPTGKQAMVIAIEQGDWCYELLQLEPHFRQLNAGHYVPFWLGDCPAFSPNEQVLVAVGSPGPGWWAPPGIDFAAPAIAGAHKMGVVYVHHLRENRVLSHDLIVNLEEGWRPEEPDGQWEFIWGPEFIAENRFRIWLPDGHPADLQLPLPETIEITHKLDPTAGC